MPFNPTNIANLNSAISAETTAQGLLATARTTVASASAAIAATKVAREAAQAALIANDNTGTEAAWSAALTAESDAQDALTAAIDDMKLRQIDVDDATTARIAAQDVLLAP